MAESAQTFRVGKRGFFKGLLGLRAVTMAILFVSPHLRAIFRDQA